MGNSQATRAELERMISLWPLVYLSPQGEVVYASPEGMAALDAVSAPQLPHPVRHVDESLLQRLRTALSVPGPKEGWITLFRRDGVASHYTARVRAAKWSAQEVLAVFFIAGERDMPNSIDELWVDVLLKAASTSRRSEE